MEWTWGSPIATGLFLLMVGLFLVFMGIAFAIFTGEARVSELPGLRRR
ncbi:MAG TPA: hypothetical protein VFW52_02445 [Candidatus Saccharimonadales bacterium]|nr:hypothetical protein [Candidatus Saccharimonadales bacterium]